MDFLLGSANTANMQLGRQIAQGALDQHTIFRALVSLVVQKADKLNRGCSTRTNSSSHPYVEPAALQELAMSLSLASSRSSLLQLIGANPRKLGLIHMRFESLPNFLCPSQTVLVTNISKVLDILNVRGGRSSAFVEAVVAEMLQVHPNQKRDPPIPQSPEQASCGRNVTSLL